ncbi:MAG: hypothetical protein KF869_06465 [Phycisphaeraceae bacterium]|nr:hypothetical protein [Phycisphaeraceae bacterium]
MNALFGPVTLASHVQPQPFDTGAGALNVACRAEAMNQQRFHIADQLGGEPCIGVELGYPKPHLIRAKEPDNVVTQGIFGCAPEPLNHGLPIGFPNVQNLIGDWMTDRVENARTGQARVVRAIDQGPLQVNDEAHARQFGDRWEPLQPGDRIRDLRDLAAHSGWEH